MKCYLLKIHVAFWFSIETEEVIWLECYLLKIAFWFQLEMKETRTLSEMLSTEDNFIRICTFLTSKDDRYLTEMLYWRCTVALWFVLTIKDNSYCVQCLENKRRLTMVRRVHIWSSACRPCWYPLFLEVNLEKIYIQIFRNQDGSPPFISGRIHPVYTRVRITHCQLRRGNGQ